MVFSEALIVVLVVLAALSVWCWRARQRRRELHALFGLGADFRLVCTDLGGSTYSAFRHNGLCGRPDAVFRRGLKIVVCDRKNRRHRGKPTRYERFQMVLYLYLVQARWRHCTVEGRIGYNNGSLPVAFCRQTCEDLLRLAPTVRRLRGTVARRPRNRRLSPRIPAPN